MASTRNRSIAIILVLVLVQQIVFPTVVLALTSGPTQPEVQGFTPIGATDMVDLFSGDLSYNIPLFDIEGYPVNLSYNAGPGMDQEASWVGLGWSLNPGVVERHMRGLPDDFKGDQVTREISMRPNITVGATIGLTLEVWGFENPGDPGASLSASVSPSFNNYDGVYFSVGLNMGLKSAKHGCSTFTGGLGLTSSSNSGLTLQPEIGVERTYGASDKRMVGGANFGLAMNSRQGLMNVSFGTTLSRTRGNKIPTKGKIRPSTSWSRNGPGADFDLGQPTYSPQISIPMRNESISLRAAVGGQAAGVFPGGFIGGSYSRQEVSIHQITNPAYGYLHLGAGQNQARALMDLNREKDGAYNGSQAALPIPMLAQDVFAVSGQKASGSYRAYRDEIGHVFDPATTSTGSGGNLGFEVGLGVTAHAGINVLVNSMTTTSGNWTTDNPAGAQLRFKQAHDHPLQEHVYFKEANEPVVEQDQSLFNSIGGTAPQRFTFSDVGGFNVAPTGLSGGGLPGSNEKSARDPRAQLFTYLDHGDVVNGLGLTPPVERTGSSLNIPNHHMSEVTITGIDGTRSVYGIPAYNLTQEDVTFSVGDGNAETSNTVSYQHGVDDSGSNQHGKEHYYSRQTTPAYAYAFLLTAVLSSDYSDIDDIPGPSRDDLGSYTRFHHQLVNARYPWRTPIGTNIARLDRGKGAVENDDKGNYVYGEKELWYLDSISTRNMVAVFHHDELRTDGRGVHMDGSMLTGQKQRRLKKVELWERSQYLQGGHPIKTVHFDYDQSRCAGVPNSSVQGNGKLTLKKVWFTYGNSNRGAYSPYVFTYGPDPTFNPGFNDGATDRWGNYMHRGVGELTPHIFPYRDNYPVNPPGPDPDADHDAAAWCLSQIKLPSGGVINIEYEADDYAFVQTKHAHRMFRLAGIQDLGSVPTPQPEDFQPPSPGQDEIPNSGNNDKRIFFIIPEEYASITDVGELTAALQQDMGGIVYYRVRTLFDFGNEEGWDYVSGYANFTGLGITPPIGNVRYGYLQINAENIDVDAGPEVSPMYRAALEQARREYSTEVSQPDNIGNDNSTAADMIMAAADAVVGILTELDNFLQGPNKNTEEDLPSDFGKIDLSDSWVRLAEPLGKKKGGGHRVKKITTSDNWGGQMVPLNPPLPTSTYTQVYEYVTEEGISSGVAAWEPNMGADENVWRRPQFGVVSGSMMNDDRFYQEEPFGELMYPSATVGYSRVVVKDEFPSTAIADAQGTGYVVNEFYTAKDFPTFSSRTDIDPQQRKSSLSVLSLLKIKSSDHMHVTQGFTIETNDMHGKPWRTTVYGQAPAGQEAQVVSYVEYHYARETQDPSRLDNQALTISPQGSIQNATIGRHFEAFADMRQFKSKAKSGGMNLNTEVVIPIIPIPLMLFSFSTESTIYRSAVLVKKVHRFGRLEKVVKMENGSRVSTENLAYDSETGTVLLTRTQNEFEDPVYELQFPAYWHYDGMGPAYGNIGARTSLNVVNGVASVANAPGHLFPGDELSMSPSNGQGPVIKGWVDLVGTDHVEIINTAGEPMTGSYSVKVIRSGRRNMQGERMATLTLLSDPLTGFTNNIFSNIVNATVKENTDNGATACACLEDGSFMATTNPYRLNLKGIWRLNKERAWLADRTRSIVNHNSNIRRDGVYQTFDPFYKLANGTWEKEPTGWTMVREVTKYNVRGQELENYDALGIPSAATFGYRASLPKSIARNAAYPEIGFDSFEDRSPASCLDDHFRFIGGGGISSKYSHTGRHSIKVTGTQYAVFSSIPPDCPPESPPCMIEIIPGTEGGYTIGGATFPVTIDSENLQGSSTLVLNSQGFTVQNTSTGWSMLITVTDAVGCSLQQVIQ